MVFDKNYLLIIIKPKIYKFSIDANVNKFIPYGRQDISKVILNLYCLF